MENKKEIQCPHCKNKNFNLNLILHDNLILISCSSCKQPLTDLYSFYYLLSKGRIKDLKEYEKQLEQRKKFESGNLFLKEYYALKCALDFSNLKQIEPDEQEKKDFFKFFYNEMDKTLKNHNLASVFSADYNLNENNSDKKEER